MYEILAELGEGLHGWVYKVTREGKEYALKKFRKEFPFTLREYNFTQRIDHPNVVKYELIGEDGLISPLMETFQPEMLTLEEKKLITEEIFQGVLAIRAAGIAHNDLHLNNILVLNGTTIINDFSNAQEITNNDIDRDDIKMLGELLHVIWKKYRIARIHQLTKKMRNNIDEPLVDFYHLWTIIKEEIVANFTTFTITGADLTIVILPKYYKHKEKKVLLVLQELLFFYLASPCNRERIKIARDNYLEAQGWAKKLQSVKKELWLWK